MKLTHALWAQHLGRMMKLHWWQQGKQKVRSTPAEKILLSKGIKIVDAKDVALPPPILPPRYNYRIAFKICKNTQRRT